MGWEGKNNNRVSIQQSDHLKKIMYKRYIKVFENLQDHGKIKEL